MIKCAYGIKLKIEILQETKNNPFIKSEKWVELELFINGEAAP